MIFCFQQLILISKLLLFNIIYPPIIDINSFIEIVQSIEPFITLLAVIIGGIWATFIFFLNRKNTPHANIKVDISRFDLSEVNHLVQVVVHINNVSDVLLRFQNIEVRLLQVKPILPIMMAEINSNLDPNTIDFPEISWRMLKMKTMECKENKYEIEPGEIDAYHFDFVVRKDIETICVYSYVENLYKHNKLGWTNTTYYNLNDN